MRTWQVQQPGEPERALRLVDIPTPRPGSGEVRVSVRAAALGFPDLLLCQGKYHDKPQTPFSIGGEAAGTVQEVGDGVDESLVGCRVVVTPGQTTAGLLAEEVVVPVQRLLPLPDDMSWEEGAALFVAYQTSHMALFRRAGLAKGETVLIHGAAGGIGSAAVQLGKAAGARTVAVAGGARKAKACADLGADVVVDHHEDDFVAVTKEVTGGRGADVIYDSVGGEVFDRSRKCIAVEGRLLVVGFASGTIPQLPVNHALLKNYSVVGFRTRPFRDDPAYCREIHDELLRYREQGFVQPLVDGATFDDVPGALRRIADRDVLGRLVVTVDRNDA
ncbi:NADPH:quinone oxidoreductase family protein [Saccharopolyspora sp. NPDC050642]|uniref:NADPH:quinone oxidoreductase family protein n=1 Tax=Saccharopolyspora sp. NPDC050642 TaxID=3157099 RepID=UPI003407DCBC